jgi:hypothetical protein
MTKPTNKKGGGSSTKAKAGAGRVRRQASQAQALGPAAAEVLGALFRLSRDTQHISARTLADEVALTATQAGEALVLLEQRGLVDASRARLTMLGLATAMQLGAGEGGGGLRKPVQPKPPTMSYESAELPIAALPSQPPAAPAAHAFGSEDEQAPKSGYGLSAPLVALRLALY